MDEVPILGRNDDRVIKQILAHYDVPAFIRRARHVQDRFDCLLDQVRQQREKWLGTIRMQLGLLQALAGDWRRLRPFLKDADQVHVLRNLETALAPPRRTVPMPTFSCRTLQRALRALTQNIERFNGRWPPFLRCVDLTPANEAREGYNRYYLLEKECAVRSARLAKQGFTQLGLVTVDDLITLFPLLPIPQLIA